jgi:hypothetical protein
MEIIMHRTRSRQASNVFCAKWVRVCTNRRRHSCRPLLHWLKKPRRRRTSHSLYTNDNIDRQRERKRERDREREREREKKRERKRDRDREREIEREKEKERERERERE